MSVASVPSNPSPAVNGGLARTLCPSIGLNKATRTLYLLGVILTLGAVIGTAVNMRHIHLTIIPLAMVDAAIATFITATVIDTIIVEQRKKKRAAAKPESITRQIPIVKEQPKLLEELVKKMPIIVPEAKDTVSPKAWLEEAKAKGLSELEKELSIEGEKYLIEVSQEIKDRNDPRSNEAIKIFGRCSEQIKRLATLRDLEALEKDLAGAPALKEAIFDNWDYLDAIRNGGMLTDRQKAEIKALAEPGRQLARLAETKGEQHLANDVLIKKQFPELAEIFKSDSKLKRALEEKYNNIVNRVWIALTMKKPKTFFGTEFEGTVIERLGFDKLLYMDKAVIHQRMQIILKEFLADDSKTSTSLVEMRKTLAEIAMKKRIELAKVPENEREFVYSLIGSAKALQSAFRPLLKDHKIYTQMLTEDERKSHPLFAAVMNRLESESKASWNRKNVNDFITLMNSKKAVIAALPKENQKAAIEIEQAEFFERIQVNYSNNATEWLMKGQVDDELKLIAWYKKYKNNLVVELVQGLTDANEILEEGCCLGIVHRIISKIIQKEGNLNDDELEAGIVTPEDRYNQARYITGINNPHDVGTVDDMEKAMLNPSAKTKFEYKQNIFNINPDDFKAAARKELENNFRTQLMENNKVALHGLHRISLKFCSVFDRSVSAGGHAVFIHIDEKKERYRIYDPNIGLLSLKKGDDIVGAFFDMIDAKYQTDSSIETKRIELFTVLSEEKKEVAKQEEVKNSLPESAPVIESE